MIGRSSKQTLAEVAYEKIKEAICEGKIVSGDI